jgi:hypothetical protein
MDFMLQIGKSHGNRDSASPSIALVAPRRQAAALVAAKPTEAENCAMTFPGEAGLAIMDRASERTPPKH